MAFPDDYHLNKTICKSRGNWGRHEWSTMGHPLKHSCNNCHQKKWVETDPLRTSVR